MTAMQVGVGIGLVVVGLVMLGWVMGRQVRRLRAALEAAELRAAEAEGRAAGLALKVRDQQRWIDEVEGMLRTAHLQSLGRNLRAFVN